MRGGGQEQPVLAPFGQRPRRDRAVAVHRVAAEPGDAGRARGRDMVRLVHDEDVEGVPPRRARLPDVGEHVSQQPLGAQRRQPRHGHDDAREQPERVGVQPVAASHAGHQLAVDDLEFQAELLPHLVLPLQRQARRADDDHRPGAVPQQQFLEDQARLDGLAEAHVVSEQQVRPRGLQRAPQRLELVGLDVRPAAERRLEGVAVRRGDRAPADGVHEGGERVRVVEAVRADRLRQALVGGYGVPDLELPHHREFLAQPVLFERLQLHHMGEAGLAFVGGAARQALGAHVGDGPGGAADVDDLALLRQGRHERLRGRSRRSVR